MFAEVISIGDELTSGQSLDTNSQWLSRRLAEAGVQVRYHTTVGDDMDSLVLALKTAISRTTLVIATGGLGPTADDLTREALARTVGRQMICDEDALQHIRQIFARRGRPMPEQNCVQALFPEGAAAVPNPEGTAPGILLDVIRSDSQAVRVCCLPGVPAEMQQMWTETVVNQLAPGDEQRHCIRSRRIRCFGAGESAIEALLPDLIRRGRQPRVGITAAEATITLTVTATAENELQCSAELEPTLAIIRECLGNLVYGENDDRLEDAVVRILRARRQSLATIEWATQGLVIRSLDDAADRGPEIQAGLVVAHQSALDGWLESPTSFPLAQTADQSHLLRLVQQMAQTCRCRFATDYALAIGPPAAGNSRDPLVESLSIAVATPDAVRSESLPVACHPAIAAAFRAKTAMNFLRLALLTR